MSRPSFLDFVGVQIIIGVLRLITPASAVYLVFCATKLLYFDPLLASYAASELLFYFLVYLPRRATLQVPPKYSPPTLTRAQRRLMFAKCLESVEHDVTDLPYPFCWFLPRHSRPKRKDVEDWLLWSFFNTSRQQPDVHEYEDELREYIETIETVSGAKFEDGHSNNGAVRSMRINFDPVDILHRPLLWYLIVGLLDICTAITLLAMGFEHYTPRESQWRKTFPPRPLLSFFSQPAPDGAVFPYWYRPHRSSAKLPLLFLHGIGVGWLAYVPFLRTIINDDPDVGILLPELMSICMHMTPRSVPPLPLFLVGLDLVLESLSTATSGSNAMPPSSHLPIPLLTKASLKRPWHRVVLVGHSYGTFVSGWIVRNMVDAAADSRITTNLAHKIAHVVFVDPIPILLSNASVAHSFLYRSPSTVCPHRLGSKVDDDGENGFTLTSKPHSLKTAFYSSPTAWQLWYFASREADIARTLFRGFFWNEGAIWREEIAALMTGCTVSDLGDLTISSKGVGRNMAVVLEGLDQVVPAQGIRRYLTREKRPTAHWSGRVRIHQGQAEIAPSSEDDPHAVGGKLEVLYHPGLDHSGLFLHARWMAPLVDVVQRYIHDD